MEKKNCKDGHNFYSYFVMILQICHHGILPILLVWRWGPKQFLFLKRIPVLMMGDELYALPWHYNCEHHYPWVFLVCSFASTFVLRHIKDPHTFLEFLRNFHFWTIVWSIVACFVTFNASSMLSILVFHNTIHPNLKGCLTHMIKGREKILFKISLGHSWLYEAIPTRNDESFVD